MRRWFVLLLWLVSRELFSQTYSIGNVYWSNQVDNNLNGYTAQRTINIPITASNTTSAVIEIRAWPDGSAEAWYCITEKFAVFAGTVPYAIVIGKNNPYGGGELIRESYDFRILLRTDSAGTILAVKSSTDDSDLNNEKFEKESEDITSVDNVQTILSEFSLSQNYPNPFNPTTTISFSVPRRSEVSIEIYSLLGQNLQTLTSREYEAGEYKLKFDALNLSAGVYIVTMKAGEFKKTIKLNLIK